MACNVLLNVLHVDTHVLQNIVLSSLLNYVDVVVKNKSVFCRS